MVATPDPAPQFDPPRPGRPTGPRTDAGKAKSSMNALKHGLTARAPLLASEDPDEFRRFVWDVVEDLAPRGPVQRELAHRAALLMWKRRRVNEAERQAFNLLEKKYQEDAEDRVAEMDEFAETPEDFAAVEEREAEEAMHGDEWNTQAMLADEFGDKPGMLDRLARYERRIDQQVDTALRLLLKLQGRGEARGRERDEGPEQAERAPEHVPEAAAPSPDLAPHAYTPAPAQNKLPASPPATPETPQPGAWTGPPGVN